MQGTRGKGGLSPVSPLPSPTRDSQTFRSTNWCLMHSRPYFIIILGQLSRCF